MNITIKNAIVFETMLILIRDNKKLQDTTGLSYLDCIKELNIIRKKLGR